MDKKRSRGRPKMTEKLVGNHAKSYEFMLTGGRKFRSRRSTVDTVYAMRAAFILTEFASEIDDLDVIFVPDGYMCRSILNQLGRMHLIENYDKESVVDIAKVAIYKKKNGGSVKDIEKYIRNGRLTSEWKV